MRPPLPDTAQSSGMVRDTSDDRLGQRRARSARRAVNGLAGKAGNPLRRAFARLSRVRKPRRRYQQGRDKRRTRSVIVRRNPVVSALRAGR